VSTHTRRVVRRGDDAFALHMHACNASGQRRGTEREAAAAARKMHAAAKPDRWLAHQGSFRPAGETIAD